VLLLIVGIGLLALVPAPLTKGRIGLKNRRLRFAGLQASRCSGVHRQRRAGRCFRERIAQAFQAAMFWW